MSETVLNRKPALLTWGSTTTRTIFFLSLLVLSRDTVASEPVLKVLRKVVSAHRKIHSVSVTVEAKNTTIRSSRYGQVEARGEFIERWCIGENGSGWAKCRGAFSQANPDGTTDSVKQTQKSVFDGVDGRYLLESEINGQKNAVGYIVPELKGRMDSPKKYLVPFDAST